MAVKIRPVSRLELLAEDEGGNSMLRLGIVRPMLDLEGSDRSTTSCCASRSACSRPIASWSARRCRARTLGTEMRRIAVIAVMVALAGCAAPPRPRPEPAALEARAELPPHMVEVAQGLFSCERGYFIKQGGCISYADIPPGPVVEISSLPSAGEGAGGGRACPSGGCGSYASPSYSAFVYSGASSYEYWPAGFYYGGLGGVPCPPHVRRFRGSEFAFGGRAGSFVRERTFASGGFFGRAPVRVHSFAERRPQAGGGFGSKRTARRR
jgi:hypothetical protein